MTFSRSAFRRPGVPTGFLFQWVTALSVAGLFSFPIMVVAQEETTPAANDESIEDELAEVRRNLVRAFNDRDMELLLANCRKDVIATWPNGRVAVGHDGVRKVIDELLGDDQGIIESYSNDPVVETRIVLNDGQTVVSQGKFNDEYTLTRPKGRKVRLDSIWTATLVKDDERWLIASFHMSANAFDNEVITLFTNVLRYWWGGMGLAVGLILGGIVGFIFGRRRVSKREPSASTT